MLLNTIQPLVVWAIENNDNLTELDEKKMVFQQDGTQFTTQLLQSGII